jgi:MscS family membrane protein
MRLKLQGYLPAAAACCGFSPSASGCGTHGFSPRVDRTKCRADRGGWRLRLLLALFVSSVAPRSLHAQAVPPPDAGTRETAGAQDEADAHAPDSPRASVARFVELARSGQYAEAAAYLDLAPAEIPRGAELARRLKAVLDRNAWLELGNISALPGGDERDGLPRYAEQVAELLGGRDVAEPVRLVRRQLPEGARWLFARATVARIDIWYARLGDRWLQGHLPAFLLRPGPRELLWWQWLALPLLLLVAWLGGRLLCRLSLRLLAAFARRSQAQWDHPALRRGRAPLTLAWSVALSYLLLPWLNLYAPAQQFAHDVLRGAMLLAFFWLMARGVDLGGQILASSGWSRQHPAFGSLLLLGSRVAKLIVFAIGLVALLSQLGYPVASLIAGLGIGGLAVALAAQKTLENLFGAFSIGADQPFRTGDFIKVDDFSGTVETIGLRSTRIRTLDRTLITVPNGKLAEMRLESFAARDRQRFSCLLGLVFETSATQMRQVLGELEQLVREHPAVWPDGITVCFKAIRESALELEISAWFRATDAEFQRIRQDLLLAFLEVIARAATKLAFPTRTLHVEGDTPPPPTIASAPQGSA